MTYTKKVLSTLSASVIALGTCLPAGIAFADPDPADPPSVGEQSGAGSTAMTMVWDNPTQEYGGTEDPNNPPSDPSDPTSPGENLAFKAPTAINFVAKANGTLLAPRSGSIHIDNYSSYGIHVSSMKIDENTADGWHVVADSSAASGVANAVWGSIGPDGDALNWASYVPVSPSTDPIAVAKPYKWNMSAYDGETSTDDQVGLDTVGNVANLSIDLSTAKTFGTIHWYLKAGNAERTAPTAPTSANFASTRLSDLHEIGEYLVDPNVEVSASYLETLNGLVGEQINVPLKGENVTMAVRLVDVSTTRGLTFEAVNCLTLAPMNATSNSKEGGWAESDLRASMNQGDIYNAYFEGTELEGLVRAVDNQSYGSVLAEGDKFWIASSNNLFGPGWPEYQGAGDHNSDGINDTQFKYYADQNVDPNSENTVLVKKYNGSKVEWWQRSVTATSITNCFNTYNEYGYISSNVVGSNCGVAPCFCL